MLKLNIDKPELIVFTSKYKQDLYNDLSITIGGTVVNVVYKSGTLWSALIKCYCYVSMCLIRQNVPILPQKHNQNKEVHRTGNKCRPYQVIGNVETGLF